MFIDVAQQKEKLRLFVESGADAIQYRRDVLAHVCPIRTTARELDFLRRREQAVTLSTDSVHDAFCQAALQEFYQRIDSSGAIPADGFPACSRDRRDGDLDLVEFRPGHHRSDLALRDLQVDDGAVADIGPAARQAVLIVAVSFEVIAPRLPPEALGNCAALDTHGCNGLSPLPELGYLLLGAPPLLGHRHILVPSV